MTTGWEDTRPQVNSRDLEALAVLPDEMPHLLPILIGGEIDEGAVGELSKARMLALNDAIGEALFTGTDRETIRMTRFQSRSAARRVWNVLSQEQRLAMFLDEKERLGVEFYRLDTDFYSGVCAVNFQGDMFVPLRGNDSMNPFDRHYINSCLVFGKAWLYDIAPWTFFCQFSFKGIKLKNLSEAQKTKRDEIQKGEYKYLTVNEMAFLYDL